MTQILYLDDEPILLQSFLKVVNLAGYKVYITSSPEEALGFLEREAVQVICSDYRMPEMNGLQFLSSARMLVPDAVQILITAHKDFNVAVDAFKVGIYRLIPKPWSRELLLGSLIEGLRLVELRRENHRLQGLVEEKAASLAALNCSLDLQLKKRTEQVIDSLVTCLDYRDEETMAHSKRVSLFSKAVAEVMGITGQELIDVEWGAMLHDVGKIGVPDAILLKPGRFTPEEWAIMRRHTNIGYHMLKHIDFLSGAARIVQEHHESFNGSGYPKGLVGKQIYIGARIFAVADTFDAITSDRPYRKARSDQAAFKELRRVSGAQLDPQCVDAFLSIPEGIWEKIREEAAVWAEIYMAFDEACSLAHGRGRSILQEVLSGESSPGPHPSPPMF